MSNSLDNTVVVPNFVVIKQGGNTYVNVPWHRPGPLAGPGRVRSAVT